MLYRRLGRTGLQVSALSFGAWVTFGTSVGRGEARRLITQAFDAGINFFDNAETYAKGEAEKIMGDVLADMRFPRDAYAVSSKVYFGAAAEPSPMQKGLSRKHVRDACDAALKRLHVDYLDLFFCHRPDAETPIDETVWAMDQLVRAGKVLYWGTSEWSADAIAEADRIAKAHHLVGPSMEQPQYSLLHRDRVEREYAPLYDTIGLGTTTWSPLASGLLTGKYAGGIPAGSRLATPGYEWLQKKVQGEEGAATLARVRRFTALAAELGVDPAPLAIAWCLSNPRVSSVILGATKPEQLAQNLRALEVLPTIDAATKARIDAAVG
ncbi:potassium channel beta subunit family protein [Silanimonas sp.]|jgi:voltage-dependent potassium channel beta subunit|uniref:potassium channel beta subunit family protein n=1 Tax=Silanimonas sp. TaxID=1929290 RepID=UPI0037CB4A57